MRRFIITLIAIATVISGCYKNPNPNLEVDVTGGERAFGSIPPEDSKNYLLEQQALLKAKLIDKGVTIERFDDRLILNIPGNIGFSINSADINWNLHAILDDISPVLKEYPHTRIIITGHSDSRGDPKLNQKLSEQRATRIGKYFIRSKISPDRITTRGVGQTQPITSNNTTQKRALNRRITVEITLPQGSNVTK